MRNTFADKTKKLSVSAKYRMRIFRYIYTSKNWICLFLKEQIQLAGLLSLSAS